MKQNKFPESAKFRPRSEAVVAGRLGTVTEKLMPSGISMASFRVVVDRAPRDRGPNGRVRVDAIECSVWKAHLIKRVMVMPPGTLIEVSGSLRRRFFRAGQGFASITEVEVVNLRKVGE